MHLRRGKEEETEVGTPVGGKQMQTTEGFPPMYRVMYLLQDNHNTSIITKDFTILRENPASPTPSKDVKKNMSVMLFWYYHLVVIRG